MLTITVPETELWNESTEKFSIAGAVVLELEHSLVSLSKWESKFEKPFLSTHKDTTKDELFEYIMMMVLTPNVDPEVYSRMTQENVDEINAYMDSKQSATTFGRLPKGNGQSEIITSELIYYWMASLNIPVEHENWHLNRLFSLIRVFSVKNGPKKKMSRGEMLAERDALNAQRRAERNSRG